MTTVKLRGEEGFTLMELLVSINLSFIVFAVMLSTYLLTYKLIFSTMRKIEEKETLVSIMQHIDQSIKQRQGFTVATISNGTVLFLFDWKDTVYVTTKCVNMSNYLTSCDLDRVILQIKPKEEELLTLAGEDPENKPKVVPRLNEYTGAELDYIRLLVWQRERPYEFMFYPSATAAQQFINVTPRE